LLSEDAATLSWTAEQARGPLAAELLGTTAELDRVGGLEADADVDPGGV